MASTIGFGTDLSHLQRDGIATWKFKHGTDTGHYSFGKLRDGKVSLEPLTEITSYQMQKQHGIRINASAKVMNTPKTTVVELMPNLGTAATNHIITLQNAKTFEGDWGLRWRFVCEGGYEKQRYIEIFADGMIHVDHASYEDLGTILSTPSAGTPDAGDTFYTWSAEDAAGYVAAAAKQIQISLDGNLETVGSVRKFTLYIEGQADQDDYGVSTVHTINIQTAFELRQTSAELAFMANAVKNNVIGWSITLADGAVLALPTQIGFEFQYNAQTDTKDLAVLRIAGGGSISPSDFAALWT